MARFFSGPKAIWQQALVQQFNLQIRAHLYNLTSLELGYLPTTVMVSKGKGESNPVWLTIWILVLTSTYLLGKTRLLVYSHKLHNHLDRMQLEDMNRTWKSYAFILNDTERCSLFFLHEHFDGYVTILY